MREILSTLVWENKGTIEVRDWTIFPKEIDIM